MKKTIFGAILAAFLVISVGWIVPIHIEAAGINDLFETAKDMSEDEDFLTLINSEAIENIIQEIESRSLDEIEQLMNGHKNGQDKEFINIFVNPITATEEFQNLLGSYDLSQFQEQMEKYNGVSPNGEITDTYILSIENNKLKIKKQDSNTLTEKDCVLIGQQLVKFSYEDNEGNLVVTNGWEDLTLVQKIMIICIAVAAGALAVGGVLYGLILLLGFLVTLVEGLIALTGTLITLLIIVAGVLVVVSVIAPFLEEIWKIIQNFLEDTKTSFENNEETPTKAKTNRKQLLLKTIQGFIKQILAFFKMQFQLA